MTVNRSPMGVNDYLAEGLSINPAGKLVLREQNPYNPRRIILYEVLGVKDDGGWILRLIFQ